MLTVRYIILPHVNEWRPQIEQRLSASFGARISIGEIVASWSGLNPTLAIQDLNIQSDAGLTVLNIPKAQAIVAWRSLLGMELRLKHLDVSGIDISISRNADGRFFIAGYEISTNDNAQFKLDSDTLAVKWLLGQSEVLVHDAIIRWNDSFRNAPELKLSGVDLALTNGLFSHRLMLSGRAPENIAQELQLIVRADHMLGRLGTKAGRHAEVYLEVQDLAPYALSPWIDVPAVTGRFAARTWIDIQQGKLAKTVVEIAGAKVGLDNLMSDPSTVIAERAELKMTGLLGDMLPMLQSELIAVSPEGTSSVVEIQASASGASFDSQFFQPSHVTVDKLSLLAQVNNPLTAPVVHITTLAVSNAHLELNLQGDWSAAGKSAAGTADLTGSIVQLSAPELYRYLGVGTSQDVRDWMRTSLTKGQFTQAALTVKGDLSEFPFNMPDEKGVFKIDGGFQNLSLNYAPPGLEKKGWPALADSNGRIIIDQLGLSMQAATSALLGTQGERIKLDDLIVNIPDMSLKPLLSIGMKLQAEGGLFLNVLKDTPLNEQLGKVFGELGATGMWNVPLAIHADLDALDKLHVKGSVDFSGGTLSWSKSLPELEDVQGSLQFSHDLITADKLSAKFLGQPLTVQGSFGQPETIGMTIEGVLPIAALKKLTQAAALSALDGQTKYRALITQNSKEGVDITVTSPLTGMAITLPAPLGKTKEMSLPLTFKWSAVKQRNDYRQSASFTLGEIMNGRFVREPDSRSKSFFSQGAIAMGATAILPQTGMAVDLELGNIDWKEWKDLVDQLSTEKVATAKRQQNVLPQIQRVALRTPRLIYDDFIFTEMTVTATQAQKGQWAARLDSKETAGSVTWQESMGALSGRVFARFSKLALGRAPTDGDETPKIQGIDEKQWSDIPSVDLNIDDFTLYGSRLGSLNLIGANAQSGSYWNIDKLEIKNPHATLTANGQWRLKGDTRGIKLKADFAISDLGKLSGFMGYPDKVREGSGKIKADIDWVNFPWVFSYSGMSGSANVDLQNGVFEHVNSRSARLLELLSLQSLQRILSFNFRPDNEFKNGFPWQSIKGDFLIEQGVTKTEDLTISSPVATILLVGDSDLARQTWNLNADVKPRFDMSGTAVATGFVVNPLVGVSALVTQFLLRNPIERAMTAKYRVRGPWDDPTLIPIEEPPPRPAGLTNSPGPGN